MRAVTCFVVTMVCLACTSKEVPSYLQQGKIPLTAPKLSATSQIIDTSVAITAELRLDSVEIFYTTDGSLPTTESFRYTKPLKVDLAGVYKFAAFHPNWKSSETSTLRLFKKGLKPKSISMLSKANSKYTGQGELTLTNLQKASLNFRDTEWLGFDSIAIADISFEKPTHIETLTVGYLCDINSWIFPPTQVVISGIGIDTIKVAIPEPKNLKLRSLQDFKIRIDEKIISLRVQVDNLEEIPNWHNGAGTKAWLFMDEWIFN